MHAIDGSNHVNNRFVAGDPSQNQPGTKITADWLNMLQDELAGILSEAGVTASKASNTQIIAAMLTLFSRANHGHSYNDLSDKPSVASNQAVIDLGTRITQLETLTQSDDLNLDDIQEIVTYIKQNAEDIANAAPDWSVIANKPDLMTRAEIIALINQQAVTWE